MTQNAGADTRANAILAAVALALLSACAGGMPPEEPPNETEAPDDTQVPAATEVEASATLPPSEEGEGMAFQLSSAAFSQGGAIPTEYSCDGEDQSPPLEWTAPPEGAESLVLIMDDPDAPAGIWDHWVLYDLPPEAEELPTGVQSVEERSDGSRHGANSWGNVGYGGPCPPSGTHRYFFRLYALDRRLDLGSGASKADVLTAMEGHVLAESELMGTYSR